MRGKKVYGYLPPEVKRTVDNIFEKLAKNDDIQMLYKKWCNLEQMKYKTYTEKEKDFPALTDNKVFQPVRNMIIRTVLSMNEPQISDPTEEQTQNDEQISIIPQLDEAEPQEEEMCLSENENIPIVRFAHNDASDANIGSREPEVGNLAMASTIFALFVNLSRCIEDDYTRKYKAGKAQIDKKLQRIIQRKKQELGERKGLDFIIS